MCLISSSVGFPGHLDGCCWSLSFFTCVRRVFLQFFSNIPLGLVPSIILRFLPQPNLKKVYGTEWVFVTGGSSGIGAALTELLLEQGFNLVIAALEDKTLADHIENLKSKKKDSNQQVISIGVDFTSQDYMDKIHQVVEGLPIGLVFCNAGILSVGVRVLS